MFSFNPTIKLDILCYYWLCNTMYFPQDNKNNLNNKD